MSEMIGRIAEAMRKNSGSVELIQGEAEHLARVAIEAMREPTEEMLNAAAMVDRYAEPGDEWKPMIDAALAKVDA